MSETDLQAEIARLQAENDRLKNRSERGITLKVSEKGALRFMDWDDFRSLSIRGSVAKFRLVGGHRRRCLPQTFKQVGSLAFHR
jgi:hypothetical protein